MAFYIDTINNTRNVKVDTTLDKEFTGAELKAEMKDHFPMMKNLVIQGRPVQNSDLLHKKDFDEGDYKIYITQYSDEEYYEDEYYYWILSKFGEEARGDSEWLIEAHPWNEFKDEFFDDSQRQNKYDFDSDSEEEEREAHEEFVRERRLMGLW